MIGCQCEVCASSDPHDTRLRSSILIESKTTSIVIDTTPDFRFQMLRQKVNKLDAVVYTHPHKDHVAGLDDIKAFCYFTRKPMPVYANALTEAALRREFAYIFDDFKYPGVPEIDLHTIDTNPFTIGDIPLIPIQVWHLKMPVLGFRIGNFTYITDANKIDWQEQQKIIGSETLVLNALRHQKHISHFTLSEAVEMVQSLQIPTGYFTHISHQLGQHQHINNTLPEGIQLAFDGLQLQVEPCNTTV